MRTSVFQHYIFLGGGVGGGGFLDSKSPPWEVMGCWAKKFSVCSVATSRCGDWKARPKQRWKPAWQLIITACQRSCLKVMFSVVSVCSHGWPPCDHYLWCHWSVICTWDCPIPGPPDIVYLGTLPLQTCSNLLAMCTIHLSESGRL